MKAHGMTLFARAAWLTPVVSRRPRWLLDSLISGVAPRQTAKILASFAKNAGRCRLLADAKMLVVLADVCLARTSGHKPDHRPPANTPRKKLLACSNENYRFFLFVFFFAKIAFQFSL